MKQAITIGVLLVSIASCSVDVELETTEADQPLIGGQQIGGISSPEVVQVFSAVTGSTPCTGTLIGSQTVLTAAHCMRNAVANSTTADISGFGLECEYNICYWVPYTMQGTVVVHPGYVVPPLGGQTLNNDFALVRLPAQVWGVTPARIATNVAAGLVTTLVGFGGDANKRLGYNTIGNLDMQGNTLFHFSGTGVFGDVSLQPGDSGGPSYSGSNCTVGVAKGTHPQGTFIASRVDLVANWIQNNAGQPIQACPPFTDPWSTARLINLSTRAYVGTGDAVTIGGFIVGGSSVNKMVAIQAIGPSLAGYGIGNALANPTITLVRSSDNAIIASNDNWVSAPNASQIQSAGFAPSNVLESAIMMSLPPGGYTVILSGVSSGTGVGLIGVYEVDAPTIPFVNISTRAHVGTGNDVTIGGFIVSGTTPKTVVVRATGPSLAAYGVPNPLPNPTLTLVRNSDNFIVGTNDDWGTAYNAWQLLQSGLAPPHPNEPAILITLDPGAYSAIVSGVGGTTGIGIVEVLAN
jgi:V8-like Glu-specific endopeptidase